VIRRPGSQTELPLLTDMGPNTARLSPFCKRFRRVHGLSDTVSVQEVDRLELDCGRELETPSCCKRLILSTRRIDAEFCSDLCRALDWQELHPRLGTPAAESYREPDAELEPEPPAPPAGDGEKPTIDERFDAWLEAQPETYALSRRYAYEALEASLADGRRRRRYGIAAIVERVRWHVDVERRSDDPFKVNNDYRSRIVRKLIEEDPRFDDFFETRGLKSK